MIERLFMRWTKPRRIARLAAALALAAAVSGCVVYPYPGYPGPGYRYHYFR